MVLFCWIKSTRRNYDKMKLNREYISNIIGNTYKNWNNGDKILINSPCGTGKTYFIKQLITTNKHTGFLIVSNRTNLRNQYKVDLKGNKNFDSICYQTLQKKLQENNDYMKQYAIIIFDEIHHLLDSANYDRYTDIIYNEIINGDYSNNIMIFLSATVGRFKDIFKTKFNNLKIYEQPTIDYSYIEEVYMYKKTNSIIETIANDNTPSKWIIFVSSKDDGEKYENELLQLGIDCKFIYSAKKKSKETKETMDEIVNNCTFSSKVLIATSILQEGVNLHDDLITNIVTETWNEIATIQSVNRVRVEIENPNRINLYIRKRKKNGIIGKFSRLEDKFILVNKLMKYKGIEAKAEFINKEFDRNTKKFFYEVDGVFYLDKDNNYKMNNLAYIKLLDDYWYFRDLSENIAQDENYQVNQVLKWFNLEDRPIINLDEIVEEQQEQLKTDNLKTWIETHMGQRLFKDDRNELIELCGLKDNRNRLQKSVSILSEYLKVNYNVELISKKVKINKKLLAVWIISKLN